MDIDTFISLLRAEAKKYHKQYTPTPEQVKMRKKLKKQGHYIEGNVRRGNYHNSFQNFLVNWANEFEVNGLKEYKVPSGYIDVMWQSKSGKNFIAFEIDTSNRIKSVKKLFEAEAKYRIWICSAPTFDMEKYEDFGEITINKIINDEKIIHIVII